MSKASYLSDWQWFNNLITNVEFTEEQLNAMFSNLTDDEVAAWIEEVKICYIGTYEEEELAQINTREDLARFYYKYPVTI